jgi:hypothetical protein
VIAGLVSHPPPVLLVLVCFLIQSHSNFV